MHVVFTSTNKNYAVRKLLCWWLIGGVYSSAYTCKMFTHTTNNRKTWRSWKRKRRPLRSTPNLVNFLTLFVNTCTMQYCFAVHSHMSGWFFFHVEDDDDEWNVSNPIYMDIFFVHNNYFLLKTMSKMIWVIYIQ